MITAPFLTTLLAMTTTQDQVLGIDVSRYQRNIDHEKVAESGMRFCMCKATEGRDYVDPSFADHIVAVEEAATADSPYYAGAYHFARPDTGGGLEDGRAEAEDFCDAVRKVMGEVQWATMPPALDFEKYSESDAQDNIPWISGWIEVVERRLLRRPMIYTGANVWKYEVGNTTKFVDYPLWQVYYSKADSPAPTPWSKWTLWQFSGGGKFQNYPEVPGAGVVDVNRFNGTLEDLEEFVNVRDPSVPVDPTNQLPAPLPILDLPQLISAKTPKNELVTRLQWLLLANGADPRGLVGEDGAPDGIPGPATLKAVATFQREAMQRPRGTGIVDFATWWALSFLV